VGVWMLATVFEDFWAHFCWSIRQQLDCMSFWPCESFQNTNYLNAQAGF
jgi:hypothetical protein